MSCPGQYIQEYREKNGTEIDLVVTKKSVEQAKQEARKVVLRKRLSNSNSAFRCF